MREIQLVVVGIERGEEVETFIQRPVGLGVGLGVGSCVGLGVGARVSAPMHGTHAQYGELSDAEYAEPGQLGRPRAGSVFEGFGATASPC